MHSDGSRGDEFGDKINTQQVTFLCKEKASVLKISTRPLCYTSPPEVERAATEVATEVTAEVTAEAEPAAVEAEVKDEVKVAPAAE